MSPSIARAVLAELQNTAPDKEAQTQDRPKPKDLTMRELTILRLLDQGHSYKDISNGLAIATATVHSHIKNIYSKLQARGKVDAIRKGRHLDII